jgi:hypothetical protein
LRRWSWRQRKLQKKQQRQLKKQKLLLPNSDGLRVWIVSLFSCMLDVQTLHYARQALLGSIWSWCMVKEAWIHKEDILHCTIRKVFANHRKWLHILQSNCNMKNIMMIWHFAPLQFTQLESIFSIAPSIDCQHLLAMLCLPESPLEPLRNRKQEYS